MALGLDEIEEVIAAAIAAEAWFTHREVTTEEGLDGYGYKVADALRVALKHVEEEAPDMLKSADKTALELFPYR